MFSFIEEIIKRNCPNKDKEDALSAIENEILMARGILNGTYKLCPKCKDYYLKKAFFSETEKVDCKVCTYVDPINSGGNDYADGYAYVTYETCPKGHKVEINRKERRY